MKIITQWLDDRTFVSANENGNSIVMDGTPASEGLKRGVSPLETLMMGVSGCSSIDVVAALKNQTGFVDCITTIEAERAQSAPRIFIKMHIHFKIIGRDLDPKLVQKAVDDSISQYCSACLMMSKAVPITHSFEISQP